MLAIQLSLAALALLMLAVWIFRKQRKATSCPAHSRVAGHLANLLALASAMAGISLLLIVWMLL